MAAVVRGGGGGSYLVAKVKSASKRAIDEKSFNKMQHLEGFPILAFSAIKHAHEETTKQDENGGGETFSNLFIK